PLSHPPRPAICTLSLHDALPILKGTYDDPTAVLAPARTFDSITEANRGGVYLSFGKYTINVVDQLTLANGPEPAANAPVPAPDRDRKSTRLNSSHVKISYAVFCL